MNLCSLKHILTVMDQVQHQKPTETLFQFAQRTASVIVAGQFRHYNTLERSPIAQRRPGFTPETWTREEAP